MKIELTQQQEEWIRNNISSGRYADEEDALNHLMKIADLCEPLHDSELEDLDWVLPKIEEGLSDIDQGKFTSSESVHAKIRNKLKIG